MRVRVKQVTQRHPTPPAGVVSGPLPYPQLSWAEMKNGSLQTAFGNNCFFGFDAGCRAKAR